MKNFRFPLDKVLHYRQLQLNQRKAAMAAANTAVARTTATLDHARDALARAAAEIRTQPDGQALATYAAFTTRAARVESELTTRLHQERRAVAARVAEVVEASRRLRVIEKLRAKSRSAWQAEMAKEVDAMAMESALRQHPASRRDTPA